MKTSLDHSRQLRDLAIRGSADCLITGDRLALTRQGVRLA